MATTTLSRYRITAATGTHKGDRDYQQDQVAVLAHPRVSGCVLAVVADGMGGKTGGRKAADQVTLTAKQLFDVFVPSREDPAELLRRIVQETHLVIKLTAMASEQEPHSTIALALLLPGGDCHTAYVGDSRIYHFRGMQMLSRTMDHSYVQDLVDKGEITEQEAADHPMSNILLQSLGTHEEPVPTVSSLRVAAGETVLVCSDGLWHYFTPDELGAVTMRLGVRESCEYLIQKARQRAGGYGDNLSLAMFKLLPPAEER
ncbi:MAG: serine/threonine-protein phosphatase [Betaproteobacteria bacterium]|nr:serine/threonine-protein phosphatase [Betaproteobacteria bacterium]